MKSLIQILNEYYQPHMFPEKYRENGNEEENINPVTLKGQKRTKPYRKFGKGLYKRQ